MSPHQYLKTKKVQCMKCLKQYFQQKLYLYFSPISDICEDFIQSRRAQDLYENIVVWRELFKFDEIWREGVVLGYSPQSLSL